MVDSTDKKKEAKKKLYRKHHLIFTSKDLYDGFNLLIFMAQYEDDIIIDDTIIEYTGNFFIYHIKCSYNLPLNLDVYKDQNGTVIDVFFTKGVEAIEASDIISSRVIKSGSKVTHTLIVEAPYFLQVEVYYDYEPIIEMRGGAIKLKGGDIIEF